MAIVRKLEKITLDKESKHTDVNATYSIISLQDGLYLQIDTYGSNKRKIIGKKSQSIRFSPEAMEQICKILKEMGYCREDN